MSIVEEKVVSKVICPRWTPARATRWVQIGAVGVIAGLWLPDWVGAYIAQSHGRSCLLALPFPPVLAYLGAVILCKGCLEGIRDMGWHFRAARAMTSLAAWLAVASFGWQFAADDNGCRLAMLQASIGLTMFCVACVPLLTMAKLAERGEVRTGIAWEAALALNVAAMAATACAAVSVLSNGPWDLWLRLAVLHFSAAILAGSYGISNYRTKPTFDAAWAIVPDDDDLFWV